MALTVHDLTSENAEQAERERPFPTVPSDVMALTVLEFARDLNFDRSVSIETVCYRFVNDANRALVWFIRFRALTAWCERTEMVEWLSVEPKRTQCARDLAANFDLNTEWEFDPERFRSAIESMVPA